MPDPEDHPLSDFRPGRSVARREDRRFLTGAAEYAADLDRPGQAHMVVIRSDHAHARLRAVETEAAAALPGVLGVHTVADLDADGLGHMQCSAAGPHLSHVVVPPRPALARGFVRHVGDPVAVVIAESPSAAQDAAEAVFVDAEPLPALTDTGAAESPGAVRIWPDAPGNLAWRFAAGDADATSAAFAAAAHTVELELVNNRVMAQPMEPRAGIGEYDTAAGTYTLTCNAQGVHGIRGELAADVFGVDAERIRVHAPDVGGGFGMKNFVYPEWILLLWAAKRHGRPLKWVAARGEDFTGAVHGRDSRITARLALDGEGNFLALDAEVIANMGAYLSGYGPGIATRSIPAAIGGIYRIPAIRMRAWGVFTNTQPVDAYRGAGKPEANYLTERLVEAAARRLGFDPVELRLKNAIDTYPYEKALGTVVDCGRIKANIEDAARKARRQDFEARRAETARTGRLRGLGFGCFLETARGNPEEGAEVVFADDGMIEIRVGTESQGQGHETALTQIAAGRFELGPERFRYVQADTAKTRLGHGHGGARTMHMGGGALARAIDMVFEKANARAAELLQAAPADVTFAAGRFSTGDGGQSVSLEEVARAAKDRDRDRDPAGCGLDSFAHVENAPLTLPNGCHAAEVIVDPETGAVELVRYTACDDYGRLINPRLAEGQVIGGITQGIGQALGENVVFDAESGQLLSGSLTDYPLPRALDLPPFEIDLEGVATAANPLGVKGSGQAGAIAAPQTIVNAVLDALAPLGIDHLDMPLTSEVIWRAIAVASEDRRA